MEITTTASAPTRRHDRLGIHSLDHFCFSAPDLAVAKRFYTAFGLDVRDVAGTLHLYTFGHPALLGHRAYGNGTETDSIPVVRRVQ